MMDDFGFESLLGKGILAHQTGTSCRRTGTINKRSSGRSPSSRYSGIPVSCTLLTMSGGASKTHDLYVVGIYTRQVYAVVCE